MIPHVRQFAVLLCPAFLLVACGPSGQQRTTQLLDQRLQTSLASDIAEGRVAIQPISGGARVTLLDPAMFANSADVLDNRENDVRAGVVEALLDPTLMRLRVADTTTLPDRERDARVRNVVQYFVSNGLAGMLQPADPLEPVPAGETARGLTLTINVQCPNWHDGSGYGNARPSCD